MNIAFVTLGCKVNQYETEVIINLFQNNGFKIVDIKDPADVYIINSCTVTQSGDKKTRQIIRRIKKNNPSAIIAITGCFPQAFPDEVIAIEELDIITGSNNKTKLLEHVISRINDSHPKRIIDIVKNEKDTPFEKMSTPKFLERTRAFLKIQDGCDKYCTYCIIPTARGNIRSKNLKDLKDEIITLASNGYSEIVLVGINLSLYGVDIGSSLIEAIELACSIDGIQRVRLSSLEPELISEDDLIRMSKQDKFCPQFHLALQSGCDSTLKRMNRKYNTNIYFEIVSNIRKIFDNPSITTDIMVGFPGETQEEFEKSLEFCKKVGFAKTHVFSYSVRNGTPAANMPNQVPQQEKNKRNHILTDATNISKKEFFKSQENKISSVLFESFKDGICKGLSKNYTPIHVKSDEDLSGKILNIKITEALEDYCMGVII